MRTERRCDDYGDNSYDDRCVKQPKINAFFSLALLDFSWFQFLLFTRLVRSVLFLLCLFWHLWNTKCLNLYLVACVCVCIDISLLPNPHRPSTFQLGLVYRPLCRMLNQLGFPSQQISMSKRSDSMSTIPHFPVHTKNEVWVINLWLITRLQWNGCVHSRCRRFRWWRWWFRSRSIDNYGCVVVVGFYLCLICADFATFVQSPFAHLIVTSWVQCWIHFV